MSDESTLGCFGVLQEALNDLRKEFAHKQPILNKILTLTAVASAVEPTTNREPLLVVNTSEKLGSPGDVIFTADRCGVEIPIRILPGGSPVDLSDMLDRETLLESEDFNKLVKKGYLMLLDSPVVTKQAEPKNNDGRYECFWCQSKTKQVQSIFSVYNVCTKCGR